MVPLGLSVIKHDDIIGKDITSKIDVTGHQTTTRLYSPKTTGRWLPRDDLPPLSIVNGINGLQAGNTERRRRGNLPIASLISDLKRLNKANVSPSMPGK